jgi:PAS domain S-box-containing protein
MGTKSKIIIVDDDPKLRKSLSDILKVKGYDCITAAKGKVALERVKEEKPAAALIDLNLPDMSGLAVMQEVMKHSPDTECVVLTGHASQASAIEAVNLGAYSYLQKPYDAEHLLMTIRQAIEMREAQVALRENEQKLAGIVDSVTDHMSMIDEQHNIVWANDIAKCSSGPDLIGKKCYATYRGHDKACKLCIVEKTFADGKTHECETEVIGADGKKITLWCISSVAARYGNGRPKLVIETCRDITERKKAEEERVKLNKELKSLLYITSHDLRSPLINIIGFSQELSRSCNLIRSALEDKGIAADMDGDVRVALNDDIPEALNFISTSANKMDSLLSGLLKLSRLDHVEICLGALDMNTVLADIVNSMEYQIKQAGATVEIEPLPPCLGDPLQINQLFSNLLDNALKYLEVSRTGLIRVYNSEVKDGRNIYCVEDNGVGIHPEHQSRIFEIFHRVETGTKSGEGLGLTIVRHILDRHNGDVWVESEHGKGSTFSVSLPRVFVDVPKTSGSNEQQNGKRYDYSYCRR